MIDAEIKTILKRCRNENKIISIYTSRNEPDRFSAGFIEAFSEQQVVLKHVTEHGLYDGYAVRNLHDIFRIDFGGLYEKRLQKLYEIQNQQHLKEFIINKIDDESNLFFETLVVAREHKMVVNVCIDETGVQESIIGLVKVIKGMKVTISQISYEGFDDGESVFDINDIIKMNCDSLDEKVIGLLNINLR